MCLSLYLVRPTRVDQTTLTRKKILDLSFEPEPKNSEFCTSRPCVENIKLTCRHPFGDWANKYDRRKHCPVLSTSMSILLSGCQDARRIWGHPNTVKLLYMATVVMLLFGTSQLLISKTLGIREARGFVSPTPMRLLQQPHLEVASTNR